MSEIQKKKNTLESEKSILNSEYNKLSREYELLDKNPNLSISLIGFFLGVPMFLFGAFGDDGIYLCMSGGILALSIAFGYPAYQKNKQLRTVRENLCAKMRHLSEKIAAIDKELKSIKTIYPVISGTNVLENCFYTVIELIDLKYQKAIKFYKDKIEAYVKEDEKIIDAINEENALLVRDGGRIDRNDREWIVMQKSLILDIIFMYIFDMQTFFYKLADNENDEDKKEIFEKIIDGLSIIEEEYTT